MKRPSLKRAAIALMSLILIRSVFAQDGTNPSAQAGFGGLPPHSYFPLGQEAPTASLPQWTFSFTYDLVTYNPVIVGTDPSKNNTTTTVPVDIIPVKMVYGSNNGNQAFDPNTTYMGLNEIASLNTYGAAALVIGTNGQIFGAGPQCCGGYGVIFQLNPTSGKLTVLHSFDNTDGWKPLALLQGIDGNFYGVTEQGGLAGCTNGCGEVFEMDGSSPHALHVIHQFQGSTVDGYQPYYLVQGNDGTLYGLAYESNSNPNYQYGEIFSLTTSGVNFAVLHAFSGSDGSQPTTLLPPYNGVLYGAGPYLGPNNNGEVFSINTNGTGFADVYAFTGGIDGGNPVALAQTNTGALYGVAQCCPNFAGEIFQVNGLGSVTVLHNFPSNGSGGTLPNSLGYFQLGTGGLLLGTTVGGGAGNAGTIFSFNPATNTFTLVYSLANGLVDPGLPLVRGKNGGSIYGQTNAGGTYNNGTIFQLMTATQLISTSPIFQSSVDYTQGGTDLGKTQYEDAYERGNFWGFGVQTNTNYHLLLGKPTILPEQVVTVPASEGAVVSNIWSGIPTGTVDLTWFDQQVRNILVKLTQIQPNVLPIFLTSNVYWTAPNYLAIGGYHHATAGPPSGQTYIFATTISQDNSFPLAMDIDALSHEVGEWIMDPFSMNSSACGGIMEVGDPRGGNAPPWGTQPYVVNGFTYHPQDLVFMRYFGAPSGTSVNDWWTFQDYGFTQVCQKES